MHWYWQHDDDNDTDEKQQLQLLTTAVDVTGLMTSGSCCDYNTVHAHIARACDMVGMFPMNNV